MATTIAIFALFVPVFLGYSGFVGFAIILLIFMSLSRRGVSGVEPLDDVSAISNWRKIMFITGLVALFLSFSISPLG